MLCSLASKSCTLLKLTSRSTVRCMANAAVPSKYHLLQYSYVPDILERRGPFRAEHIAGAKREADAGKIILAGAFGETPEGALFVWKDSSVEDIQAFVAADPYVKAGLVPSWHIKPYAVVVP
ncbi:hypothetical protein CEUSTIGMA_g2833.t1 [Chlamydomonas eustigma]|uniref:YCII-related domain-containing protein n=1 Tax=Chlamydomonas eustigma TaxID=1157962 RepID=A0A250WXG3_9CHLO|nr:hypothetical protein CEUSTIGMA_g2833.t1 [Chlamydomonas eustigma]|eukprot:GAX75389.1 hypothetical protein CEUSTIGMA_g2833.t1 [Chlamydomonas eustigma]